MNECGMWNVECGMWIVDCGLSIVDCGLWVMGYGLWIVDCGLNFVVLLCRLYSDYEGFRTFLGRSCGNKSQKSSARFEPIGLESWIRHW